MKTLDHSPGLVKIQYKGGCKEYFISRQYICIIMISISRGCTNFQESDAGLVKALKCLLHAIYAEVEVSELLIMDLPSFEGRVRNLSMGKPQFLHPAKHLC